MPSWSSLYLPGDDSARIVQALQEALTALGYELFNPFGQLFTKAYPRSVRLFVAPARDGWVRVIGEPDEQMLAPLSNTAPCLYAALDGQAARIAFYAAGSEAAVHFAPYLRPGNTLDDLASALDAATAAARPVQTEVEAMPLPADMHALASRVDMKQAQSMFTRLTGSLMQRTGGDADAARKLLAASAPPDWNSADGQRIQAVIACLTVPDDWRAPDFTTLRDAYQVHERLRRNPNADLYPGDAEARSAVMNALDYTPVYGGIVKS